MAEEPRILNYRRQVAVIALAGVLVTAFTMACGWFALKRFDALQSAWEEHTERATAIGDALADLERFIGYGGFIHNFKNYVLRRDAARYLEPIKADIVGTTAALDALERLLRTKADLDALAVVRATFGEYARNFELVSPMIQAGADRSEIDAVVKVDDGPALAALQHLVERALERARVAKERTAEVHAHGREYLLAGALALVCAIGIATFTLIRFLDRIMEARREAEEALRRQLMYQDDLVRAEKMAALGGLVAGVAHEINTPVGVSLTAASHLEGETAKIRRAFETGDLTEEELTEFFTTAAEAARLMTVNCERASELTQSFKQVAVDQTGGERRAFDLAEYLDEILLSLRPRIKKTRITVGVECPAGLVLDSCPGAFSQIVTNLIVNAVVHAYEPDQDGRVAISAGRDGEFLTMRVRDDGRGIPPESRERVFEPFFTTRRGAGGSGLGLHIVHNIVTQTLKGTIRLESGPGRGTEFAIRIPFSREMRKVVVHQGGKRK